MLHLRNQNLVPLADKFAAIRICDQIYALGRAADKDTFLGLFGINKALQFFARRLVRSRRLLAEVMHPAVNIRMLFLEVFRTSVDHELRHLRRSPVVQIDKRLAVNRLRQHGKILPDLFNVPIPHCLYCFHFIIALPTL